jgi:hypothetical protein
MNISNAIEINLDANKINVDSIFRERFKSLDIYQRLKTQEDLREAWESYKDNLIRNIEQMEL